MTRHRIPRDAKSKAVTQMNQSLSTPPPPLTSTILQPKPAIASTSAQAILAQQASASLFPPTPTPQLPMPSPPTMMEIGEEESDDDFEDFEPPATPGVYLPPPTPRVMRGPPSDNGDNGDYPKTPGPPLRMPDDIDIDPDYSQPPPTPTPMIESDHSGDEHEDIEIEDEEEEAEEEEEEGEEEEEEEEEVDKDAKKGVKQKGKATKKKITPKAKTVKKGGKAKTKTIKTKGKKGKGKAKPKAKKGKKKVSPIEIETVKIEEEEAANADAEADKTPKDDKDKDKEKAKSPKQKKNVSKPGVIFTMDQMVQNSIIFMLIMNQKKNPVKRSEVVRHCMNGQTKDFPELIEKLTEIYMRIFGIKLYGVEEGLTKNKEKGYVSYLLCSIYLLHISDSVTTRSIDYDAKRSILFIILSIIFMMNRSVDEDTIWKFMEDLSLSKVVNVKKREDLHRFIKSEYVTPCYLIFEEINETDPPIIRYSWGLRAEQEISKYNVLKFVCKIFSFNKLIPEKKPSDFKLQYAKAFEEEPELIEADREKEEADALAAEMEAAAEAAAAEKTPEKDEEMPSTSSGSRKNRPSKDAKIDSLVEDVEAINLNFDDAQSDRSWSSEGSCHSGGPRSNRRLSRSRSRSRTPPSGSSDNELPGVRSLRDRKMDIDDEMPGPSSGINLPLLKGSSPRGGKAGRGRGRGRGKGGYGDGNQSDSDPDQITSFEPIIRTTRSRRGRAKATPVVVTGDIDQTGIKQELLTPKPPVRKPSPRRGRGRKKRRGKRGGYRGPAAAAAAAPPVEEKIEEKDEEENEGDDDRVEDLDDDELLPPPPTPFIQPPTPFVPPPTPTINLNFTDDLESPFERRGPKTRARGRKISEPMTPYFDGPPPTPAPRPESPGAYDAPPPTPGSSLGMDMEIDDDDDLEMDISYDTRLELNLQFDPNKPSGSGGLRSSNQDMMNLDQPPPTPSPIRATRSSKRSTTSSRQQAPDEPQFSADDKALEKTLAELVEEFAASGPFPSDDNRDPFGSLSHPRRGK